MAKYEGPFTRKERSRPAVKSGRLAICQLGRDDRDDTANPLRVQLLTSRLGLTEGRAALLSGMIWEAAA